MKKIFFTIVWAVMAATLLSSCHSEPQYADKPLMEVQQQQRNKYLPLMYGTWTNFNVLDDNSQAILTTLTLSADSTFTLVDQWMERDTPQGEWHKMESAYNEARRGEWLLMCKRNDTDNSLIETYIRLDERKQGNSHVVQYVLFHDATAQKLHIDLYPVTEFTKAREE